MDGSRIASLPKNTVSHWQELHHSRADLFSHLRPTTLRVRSETGRNATFSITDSPMTSISKILAELKFMQDYQNRTVQSL